MLEFLKIEKKHKPIIYNIYKYLKSECVGYESKVKGYELMKEFNIKDHKTLRSYIEEIRQSDELQKFVCSEAGQNGGYWLATNENEVAITLEHLYKRSMEMLRTYSILKNKARLNNQRRLKLSQYEKEVYQSIIEKGVENAKD